MSSIAVPSKGSDEPTLIVLPPELAVHIFCLLPSFSEVFALSAASCRLRSLWIDNVRQIYGNLGPRTISCEREARRFLLDHHELDSEFPMSHKEVVSVLRTADVVEKAIDQFEREILPCVRVDDVDARDFYRPEVGYRPDVDNPPPGLTFSERKRFIHSYYTIWSLMKLDMTEWDSRLDAMTTQELYYLLEMSQSEQSIGTEEVAPLMQNPNAPSRTSASKKFRRPEKRMNLEDRTWQQIQSHSSGCFDYRAPHTSVYTKHFGCWPFVAIFDHFQPHLKEMVWKMSLSRVRPSPTYHWNDDLYY